MSLAIFYSDLDALLSEVSKAAIPMNVLSGISRVNIREVYDRFSELLKDASDWSRNSGKIDLARKLDEIIGEERSYSVDASQLEASRRVRIHCAPFVQPRRSLANPPRLGAQ